MSKQLRDYQVQLLNDVFSAWAEGHKNVLAVSPTGSGKALTLINVAKLLADSDKPVCIEVHRKELVVQLCATLSEEGIQHNIIAPKSVIKEIIQSERKLVGRSFYHYQARITVASVDTLNSRVLKYESWRKGIRALIIDEAAHVTKKNKWGRTVEYFPDCIIAGFTATPRRLDRRGLGAATPEKDNDGIFNVMVEGPRVKWLIEEGYLANYRIAIPESKYKQYLKSTNEMSDYSRENMAEASLKSHIEGDVVESYLKFCKGKQAIIFASDIQTAMRMESEYIAAGVKAKTLTGDTPNKERVDGIIDFREKRTQVLINVDLFDEGLDVPGLEAVIMARPTKSLSKYLQMVGRGLRPFYEKGFDLSNREGRLAAQAASIKPYAIIIDHVGNVEEHGLPDSIRKWSLDRPAKRGAKISLHRICKNVMCNAPFDRSLSECPYCRHVDQPADKKLSGREAIKQVDGDMFLLTPEQLKELYDSTILESPESIARKVEFASNNKYAGIGAAKNQQARIEEQMNLSKAIAQWAGYHRDAGLSDRQFHKLFNVRYGKTITEALSEPRKEMEELRVKIEREYGK